jgi:succinate-semialdehyde dehydrogenase / glutarate-semialdehyde dehydrogenase
MYSDTGLFIRGEWQQSHDRATLDVLNPANGERIGSVAGATFHDLERAVIAAQEGFAIWRKQSAYTRSGVMRRAATLLRERAEEIAVSMTLEQGKPLGESRGETLAAADIIEWFAEEARRTYGRTVPARSGSVTQLVVKEPIGPVAAFTPWNFPLNQSVRKVSAALAAGCSVVLKGPEETPASCAALVQAFADAGVPPGSVNLVFGIPADISTFLIAHPAIRKITFTGSTPVGKQLAAMAGQHMKRATMELGGHAPALVFDDADVGKAASILVAQKFRNAGQVCVSPTRFLVQETVAAKFISKFVTGAEQLIVGDGMSASTQMGPLANRRRVQVLQELVDDAVNRGATLATGGKPFDQPGFFFKPTVLLDVPRDARVMNEEPFGPVAVVNRFANYEEAISEANRLPFGLAAYAYTRSLATANALAGDVESGMLSVNHHGIGLPEVPFGGIKDSGYGSEGGIEAMEGYLITKLVTVDA